MAGVSVSHLILFIASLLIAASVAGTMTASVGRLSGAIDDESLEMGTQIRSDVEVISDPAAGVYNTSGSENVTLLVKNVGTNELTAESQFVDTLLDGRYQTDVSVSVVDAPGSVVWDRGDVVRVEIDTGGLAAGDHRVKLVVEGDEEVFRFRV